MSKIKKHSAWHQLNVIKPVKDVTKWPQVFFYLQEQFGNAVAEVAPEPYTRWGKNK